MMPLSDVGLWAGVSLLGVVLYFLTSRLRHDTLRFVIRLLAFSFSGLGINELSYASYFGPVGEYPGVFWLSSGLLVGVLLTVNRRWYGWYVAAAFGVDLFSGIVLHHQALNTRLCWTTANIVEGVLGSVLLRVVLHRKPDITQPRALLLYCVFCLGVASMTGALIGIIGLSVFYNETYLLQKWQVWAAADAMGMLSLGSAILAWNTEPIPWRIRRNWRRLAEAVAMFGLLLILAWVSVGPANLPLHTILDYPYLVLPILGWAALRFDARVSTAATLIVALITVYTANGTFNQLPWVTEPTYGPLRPPGTTVSEAVLTIQAFLFVGLFATQLMLALNHQRIRAERETLEIRDQLYASQRMESIAQLASGIAHDLNNLLAVIALYRDQVEDRVGKDAELSPALDAMDYAMDHATSLSRSLLNLGRYAPNTIGPLDPGQLLRRVEAVCRPLLPKSIDFVLRIDPSLRQAIQGNAHQLQQVLLNLILNARDAMQPGGGTLTVWVKPSTGTNRQVEFGVRDTGCGIDPKDLEHIFEPLFTTKPPDQGTGLGLSIVRSIVEGHHGRITIDTQPGRGTTFHVLLPLELEKTIKPSEHLSRTGVFLASGHQTPGSVGPIHTADKPAVLLLVDNPQVRGAIVAGLYRQGWSALSFTTYDDYQAAVGQLGEGHAIGVIDLRMLSDPARVTDQALPIPTLLLCSQPPHADQQVQGKKYLVMPFKITELIGAIKTLC